MYDWVCYLPAGICALVAIFIAADVGVSHPQNCSTLKLRLMVLFFGLACIFGGMAQWYFDTGSWRLSEENRWISRWFFLIAGSILVPTALLRSRESLIKDSEYFTRDSYEIDVCGSDDISPAQRVKRVRDSAGSTSRSE
ncbi:MAG: hypothetical protein ACR2QZ_15515 [Woeseiaceae bacterium]